MRILLSIILLAYTALPLAADYVVASRNIRPSDVLTKDDVILVRGDTENAFSTVDLVLGLEARVALYAGRAILNTQVGRAASIERNQIVEIVFVSAGLSMSTEGRALGRGSEGQRIRVMNLASKTSIFGIIQRDGTVRVNK
ncbi:flagellar basal body P-ring formation chaperone FlgA [Planktotalea sp.]|uniref:flagellar basal body P-ring formation chaperone FlgA n=1 Tax=Planktotalea sp. TaxID=2029877 RepID=UPI003D6B439F